LTNEKVERVGITSPTQLQGRGVTAAGAATNLGANFFEPTSWRCEQLDESVTEENVWTGLSIRSVKARRSHSEAKVRATAAWLGVDADNERGRRIDRGDERVSHHTTRLSESHRSSSP